MIVIGNVIPLFNEQCGDINFVDKSPMVNLASSKNSDIEKFLNNGSPCLPLPHGKHKNFERFDCYLSVWKSPTLGGVCFFFFILQ